MTTTSTGIIDEIRRSVDEGAELSHVDSTDDRLVLVLDGGAERDRYRLDAQATRSLLEADLIDQLTPSTNAKKTLFA